MQYLARTSKVIVLLLVCFFSFHESKGQYPSGSPVAVNGKLKVIGRYLRNECGNPAQLRGMATHGVQWFGNCVNASAIDVLANDWNADVLRVSMYIQEGGYVTNPSYWKGWIDNVVDECGKRGIYVIIDFHVHIPGDPMSYLSDAKEFWTYMATKHKDKKHVLYEICNEPNGVTWSRVKEYANQIIPLIRAIDPTTVIVVGSSTWSQDVDLASADRLNYSNLVYALHFYSHGDVLMTKANKAIANGLPLFVSEFGTTTPDNTQGPFLDLMEERIAWLADEKISWANWSFSDKGELSAALIPGSCGSTNWNNTSTSGTWVKSKIKSPADNFTCNGDTFYVKSASTPYLGTPINIPGKIEAENYDKGANGVAYRNFKLPSSTYRTDGVEVYSTYDTTETYAIGNFEVCEWLNYTISAAQSGVYDIQLRVSALDPGKMLYLELDGKNVSGVINVPQTGKGFETITVPNVKIVAGTHDIKLHAISKGVLINFLNIVPAPIGASNRLPQVYIKNPSSSVIYTAPSDVLMTAFATDPDGTVAKVEFYNGTSKLGEVSTPPFNYTWKNVDSGTYSIYAIATDNTGSKSVSKGVTIDVVSSDMTSSVGTGLKAQFFNNKDLTGSPVLSRNDTTINFNWAAGSPDPSVSINSFSARWTGKIKPKYSEDYTFYVNSDDGFRLFIDNVPVITEWRKAVLSSQVTVPLVANALYDIRLEYFDNLYDAKIDLSWSSASQTKQVVPKSNFYPSTTINLAPSAELLSPTTGTFYKVPASILLQATAIDPDGSIAKVEFYNGSTLIGTDLAAPYEMNWSVTQPGSYSITALSSDNQGAKSAGARASDITVVPATGSNGTGLKAQYFNNITLTGPPVLTRTDPTVDFDWLSGSPASTVNVNQFSASWTGQIQPLYSEEYTFYTTSDDGTRLYVNDVLLVNNWTNHASTVNTGKITLKADQKYSIRLEYYDNQYGAEIRLAWSSASQAKQAIPQWNLYPETETVVLPTVSIVSPAANATYTAPATIPITVNASDVDGSVSKVEFYNGSTKIGESVVSPFSFSWTSVAIGTYVLSAKAIDNQGNTATSSSVSISVTSVPLNQVPVVSISAPVNGASFTAPATISITATASDADGTVSKVEFYNGTTKIGEDVTSPYSFIWSGVTEGTYVLSTKATDNNGGVGSSSNATITVTPATNQAPTVSLSAPITGASFTAPATISITATASDADGTVSKVEFYNGTTKIGEDVTSPYSFSWTGVAVGTYVLSAKATDNSANVSTSSTVSVSVTPSSNGNCVTEALPVAANWVVRNQWTDQNNSSGVSDDVDGLKVTHRAWGQDQLYLIQTGKKYNVSSSNNYSISFDFKNDATMAAANLEIGFATGVSGSGPIALQPLNSIPAGVANGSFGTKTVSIKPTSSSEVSLTIGLKWSGQINKQFNGFIKNIAVCSTSVNARTQEQNIDLVGDDVVGLSLSVAPNPSDQSFRIHIKGTQENVKVSVVNLTGEVIYESAVQANSILDLGHEWNKGIYLIKVQDGENSMVSKLHKN